MVFHYCTFSTGNFFISLETVLGIDFSLFWGLLFTVPVATPCHIKSLDRTSIKSKIRVPYR